MRFLTFLIQKQPSRCFTTLLNLDYGMILSGKLTVCFKNTFPQEYPWTAASKFSAHMINTTREKIELSCTNCFRSIVLLVFALTTAWSKFRFRSLRNKMINLVLDIKYHFDFWLQFDINKKCIYQGFTEISVQLHDITLCRGINCSWESYEFNKCTISLKIQQLRIEDLNFFVISVF